MTPHPLVHSGGYVALFVVIAIECVCIPIPGEASLVAAASLASTPHNLSIWIVFVDASAAVVFGSIGGYLLGRAGGQKLLLRFGKYIRCREREIKIGRYLFETQGTKVVIASRFVSILRSYAPFFAGTAKMTFRLFTFASVIGAAAWSGIYSLLGFFAGSFLQKASTPIDIGLGCLVVVLVLLAILMVRKQSDRIAAKAEAAYPGSLSP